LLKSGDIPLEFTQYHKKVRGEGKNM